MRHRSCCVVRREIMVNKGKKDFWHSVTINIKDSVTFPGYRGTLWVTLGVKNVVVIVSFTIIWSH